MPLLLVHKSKGEPWATIYDISCKICRWVSGLNQHKLITLFNTATTMLFIQRALTTRHLRIFLLVYFFQSSCFSISLSALLPLRDPTCAPLRVSCCLSVACSFLRSFTGRLCLDVLACAATPNGAMSDPEAALAEYNSNVAEGGVFEQSGNFTKAITCYTKVRGGARCLPRWRSKS